MVARPARQELHMRCRSSWPGPTPPWGWSPSAAGRALASCHTAALQEQQLILPTGSFHMGNPPGTACKQGSSAPGRRRLGPGRTAQRLPLSAGHSTPTCPRRGAVRLSAWCAPRPEQDGGAGAPRTPQQTGWGLSGPRKFKGPGSSAPAGTSPGMNRAQAGPAAPRASWPGRAAPLHGPAGPGDAGGAVWLQQGHVAAQGKQRDLHAFPGLAAPTDSRLH